MDFLDWLVLVVQLVLIASQVLLVLVWLLGLVAVLLMVGLCSSPVCFAVVFCLLPPTSTGN